MFAHDLCHNSGLPGLGFALKGTKVMEAITGRIAIGPVFSLHAGWNHFAGGVLVTRLFFFFFFAGHANRLMVINRQKPPILIAQRFAASLACLGTGKLFLPFFFHVYPPSSPRGLRLTIGPPPPNPDKPELKIEDWKLIRRRRSWCRFAPSFLRVKISLANFFCIESKEITFKDLTTRFFNILICSSLQQNFPP